MSYAEYPEFEEYQQRWNYRNSSSTDLRTTIATILVGGVIGAFFLTKTLDFLGYPIWLRIHQLLEMSMEVLSLRRTSSFDAESGDDDTMQSGGMFGSLFGTSPGSLLQKGMRGVASAFSTGPSNVPPGLGNISNSCYQNSVIQGLASLPSLRDYLSKTTSEHPSLSPESTNGALFDIITKLNDPENKGSHFWIRGKLKSMSTWEQQDAQEYYSKVLDALDEEIKKTASSKRRSSVSWLEVARSLSDSPDTGDAAHEEPKDAVEKTGASSEQVKTASNPLEGRLAQRVGCTSCGYSEGLTLIPFNCITVSLGKNYGYDIRECLDEYTTLEFIDGVECAKCTLLKMENTLTSLVAKNPDSPLKTRLDDVHEALEKEDFEDKTLLKRFNILKKNWVKSTKSKQAVVARAPQSLVLHVNRSSFNEYTGMPYKNTAGVDYPTVLDLGNWCLGSTPSDSQTPEEEWPRDPRESMLAGGDATTNSPFQYRLRAAVTHYGSHGNGHYVCYRSHPTPAPLPSHEVPQAPSAEENGEDSEDTQVPLTPDEAIQDEQWWRFSDDSVYAVSEDEAHQGNVFMLFYERVHETPVAEDAPLPPADITASSPIMDDEAAAVPLPADDDDLSEPIPAVGGPTTQPEAIQPPLSVIPSSVEPDTEMSESEEDGASTQVTDCESEADMPTPPKSVPVPQVPPHLMRTAGSAGGSNTQQSLPLVSAT
jgi:ubiquitin carboxyl-terminal hydrolase 1